MLNGKKIQRDYASLRLLVVLTLSLAPKSLYYFCCYSHVLNLLKVLFCSILGDIIRATASICVKFLFYFSVKTYFFYFTRLLLQNTHIKPSIIHPFLFKYSFIIIIIIIIIITFIFSHTLSLILISHTFSLLLALFSSEFRPP